VRTPAPEIHFLLGKFTGELTIQSAMSMYTAEMVLWTRLIVRLGAENRMVTKGY